MGIDNIESLVRQYVSFRHGVAGGGWNRVYCEFCGDGSRTKGPRGGWSFTDGGDTAFYHCFNCGINESFSTNREHAFSKKMREVLDSFNIPKNEYLFLTLKVDKQNPKEIQKKKIEHKQLDFPLFFKPLIEMDNEVKKPYKDFLHKNYNIKITDYSFFVGTLDVKINTPENKSLAKALNKRLIIPFYKNGKLIYYQARDISDEPKLKYISANIPKNNILFNIDNLNLYTDAPLYVVEGPFDAINVNGVATLGNELTGQQVELLKASKRRKVLIPDFKGDSSKLIEQFIDNDWEISFPEYRTDAKDVSEAIVKFGRLYTAIDIVNSIKTADVARVMLNFVNNYE